MPLRLGKTSLRLARTLALVACTTVAAAASPVKKPTAHHGFASSHAGVPRPHAGMPRRRLAAQPAGKHAAKSTRPGRRGASAGNAYIYAPPLVLHTPLPERAGALPREATSKVPLSQVSPSQEPLPANAVPAEVADASPPDQGAVRTVAQQLAQGGSALQFPRALSHFFAALHGREDTPGNGTVRVLQFGDSHTAADMFTGEARARMQSRFGDGGVGFSYAGHPFAGYRILGSGRGQSGSWTTLGTHFTQLGDAELGLGGVAIQSSRAGDTASLDAPCLTLEVDYLRQPAGGSFQLSDNGFPVQTVSTGIAGSSAANVQNPDSDTSAAPAANPAEDPAGSQAIPSPPVNDAYTADRSRPAYARGRNSAGADALENNAVPEAEAADNGPVYSAGMSAGLVTAQGASAGSLHYDCPAGTHHFTLTSEGGGAVRLLGTVALQPGITWEAAGINGAEAPLLLRWNAPVFRSYLAAASPDLIVLAYGTNEAAAHWSGEEYRATFTRLVDMLHMTSPASSILVVGPADRSLGSTTYTTVGRGRRARRIAHRYYAPYIGTDRIISAQREVCRTHDCAFWDWKLRQGGLGAMNRWVSADYAQPDHTHFTATGYHALADALVADLLAAYSGYQSPASAGQ